MEKEVWSREELQVFKEAWQEVGESLSTALYEIAAEIGGEELAARVAQAATSENTFPNPEALRLLEEYSPGAAARVMDRMSEIEQETQQRMRARATGRGVVSIVQAFGDLLNITGRPRRR